MTLPVSRETYAPFVAMLLQWNARINLIGKSTEDDVWQRHIADSLTLVPHLPQEPASIADLGTGAGLPGIVLALAMPQHTVHLLESDGKKIAFLQHCQQELVLKNLALKNIALHHGRMEVLPPVQADFITARACAPLDKLLHYAARHATPNATALFLKGSNADAEIIDAKKTWTHATITPIANGGSVLIKVMNFANGNG
jgi:16S rRNA (guanine527-N7)-methyltransferase